MCFQMFFFFPSSKTRVGSKGTKLDVSIGGFRAFVPATCVRSDVGSFPVNETRRVPETTDDLDATSDIGRTYIDLYSACKTSGSLPRVARGPRQNRMERNNAGRV